MFIKAYENVTINLYSSVFLDKLVFDLKTLQLKGFHCIK